MLNPIVATMTLVREPAEERSVFDALASLARAELPVIVADGGSPPGFVQAVRALPQYEVVQPQAQGLVLQVRAALERARELRVPWILYTEPDKRFFFAERLAWLLAAALHHAGSALILASRSREAFDTFPSIQRLSESSSTICSALSPVSQRTASTVRSWCARSWWTRPYSWLRRSDGGGGPSFLLARCAADWP